MIPTEFAFHVINNMDDSLTKPDFTAVMEYALSEIVSGNMTMNDYINCIKDMVNDNIQYAQNTNIKPWPPYPCPLCNGGYLVKRYSKDNGSFYCSCINNCKNPQTSKPFFSIYGKGQGDGEPVVNGNPVTPILM